ncbi:MAG: tyrosine-type recombinase/integrase [Flavobacteriales bacterium]|nr:tyrosine-type recombinase/integrase [Flavobacteriales bacterium]
MEFGDFALYLSTEKRQSVHTVTAYLGDLRQFADWCHENLSISRVEEVDKMTVRSFVAFLVSGGQAPRTVHRKIASLNAWFRFLQKTGLSASNPARGIAKPKLPSRLPTVVEESRLADVKVPQKPEKESLRDNLVIKLLYETGMRRAELIGMHVHDVDYQSCTIKVLGKRNKMRIIPVTKPMTDSIREYRLWRDTLEHAASHDFLMVSSSGKPMTEKLVYRIVTGYLSGVTTMKKRSPHVLRHSFATHMLNAGADLNVIKEILGHASLAATQVYTHNSIEKLKAVHWLHHPRNIS